MFGKYFGDKKRSIVEKKKNKIDKKFKLVVTDWVDDVLTKIEDFFDSIEDAKKEGNKRNGSIKIYDRDERLIHSQKNHHKHGRHHHHHDDDDDLYA